MYQLKTAANAELWETVKLVKGSSESRIVDSWEETLDMYGEAVWWHNRGVLEKEKSERVYAFGKSATAFASVISKAGYIREIANQIS